MLKFMQVIVIAGWIITTVGMGILVYGCYKWVSSGEVGSDIGGFAREIESGYKAKE